MSRKADMDKILFFSEFYAPAKNSTAFFVARIIAATAEKYPGIVRVICATQLNGKEVTPQPDNLQILRLNPVFENKDRLSSRIMRLLTITVKFAWHAFWSIRRKDTVFAVTNPAFMIFFLAMLRCVRRFRFILLAYDIFPENVLAAGLCHSNSAKYKVSKRLFDWAYSKADTVIAIGRDMREILIKKGVSPEHIQVVTNWSPDQEIAPSPKNDNQYIQKFHLQEKIVFLFAGNIGRVQGIPNLLNAIELTSSNHSAFIFIGDGAMKGELAEFKAAHPEKHLYIVGNQPIDKANDFLSAGDVALIPLADGMFGLGVPSKSYFYMAAGMPLLFIGDPDSEIALTIGEENNGWQVDADSPEKLAALLDQIANMGKDKLTEYAGRSRNAAEKRFAEKLILQQFNQIIIEQN